MREMVEPRWSRSGSIAIPPTAATQPSWATVPETGATGQRGRTDGEPGKGVGVTEHRHGATPPVDHGVVAR